MLSLDRAGDDICVTRRDIWSCQHDKPYTCWMALPPRCHSRPKIHTVCDNWFHVLQTLTAHYRSFAALLWGMRESPEKKYEKFISVKGRLLRPLPLLWGACAGGFIHHAPVLTVSLWGSVTGVHVYHSQCSLAFTQVCTSDIRSLVRLHREKERLTLYPDCYQFLLLPHK